MRLGVFYEHQLPQPWEEGSEQKLFNDALEQIELADRLGFDNMWEVEHHFLEEYSHSSAPEVFLAAVSQRTRKIRLESVSRRRTTTIPRAWPNGSPHLIWFPAEGSNGERANPDR